MGQGQPKPPNPTQRGKLVVLYRSGSRFRGTNVEGRIAELIDAMQTECVSMTHQAIPPHASLAGCDRFNLALKPYLKSLKTKNLEDSDLARVSQLKQDLALKAA